MESIMRFLTPKSCTAYIDDTSSVRQALEKMRYHGYNALPVIDDDGMYVGTLTEGDFLFLLLAELLTVTTEAPGGAVDHWSVRLSLLHPSTELNHRRNNAANIHTTVSAVGHSHSGRYSLGSLNLGIEK